MTRILITGGSGFIGRNVREYLSDKKEYEIFCPSSTELDCTDEERVKEYLRNHNFDIVLCFAVYMSGPENSKDKSLIVAKNLQIFLNFANNSGLYGRMYYSGSGAEYDKRYPISMVSETDIGKTIPVDSYGLVKYTIGRMIENSENIYNLRIFGLYGKYEYYPTKFISNVCCKAIKGLPLSMRRDVYFDYLWIDDFCRMLDFFLCNKPKYHTYNVVSGTPVSLTQICDAVREVSGKKLPVYVCMEGLANEYTASNGRFMEECPDFVFTPLREAVEELYRWYSVEADIDLYKLIY